MSSQEFTAYLDREPTDDEIDALYEAGFDDSMVESGAGTGEIHVNRDAPTMADAIHSVVRDADKVGFTVIGLRDEDQVSLKTVAARTGRSYEAVRRYANGTLGPGGFPPVTSGDGWTLVSWTAVADWFRSRLGFALPDDERGRTLAAANHMLRARALVPNEEWQRVRVLIPA